MFNKNLIIILSILIVSMSYVKLARSLVLKLLK